MLGEIYGSCQVVGLAVMLTRAQIDLYTSAEGDAEGRRAQKIKSASVWSGRSRGCFLSATVSILFQPRIPQVRGSKEEERRHRRPSSRTLRLSKNARALTNPVDVFMSARKGVAPAWLASTLLLRLPEGTADIFRRHH